MLYIEVSDQPGGTKRWAKNAEVLTNPGVYVVASVDVGMFGAKDEGDAVVIQPNRHRVCEFNVIFLIYVLQIKTTYGFPIS